MMHDLRSDFLGPPTAEMLAAMAEAAACPLGFGLRDDPRQRALETYAAELLGKEDALLFPTCTMANLVAVMAQSRPGDLVLADAASHTVLSEAGGLGGVAGVMVEGLPGDNGVVALHDFAAVLDVASDPQRPVVALLLLETTHNRSGGRPLPMDYLSAVGALAAARSVPLHLDGARFFNAAIALNISPAVLAAPATTVSLSLNKGLCAPNGALLAGPRAVIARALVLRQRLGGGIRPAGAIAAAGLVALRTMLPQLAEDHANAARLAAALRAAGLRVRPDGPPTNMLIVELGWPADRIAAFLERLAQDNVLAIAFGPGRIRLCLHRGIAASSIPEIATAFATTFRASGGGQQEH